MGEFQEASRWMRTAFVVTIVSFILLVCGLGMGSGMGLGRSEQACIIIGFLCWLTATFLIICILFFDELKSNKIALICYVIFALIAGLASVIGVAVSYSTKNCGNSGKHSSINNLACGLTSVGNAYAATSVVCGSLLIILAAIFAILQLVGVGAPPPA